MKIKLRKAYSSRGANMGRLHGALSGKIRIQKMRMSADGCYDEGGAYWGQGDPMYVAEDRQGNQSFLRAKTRDEACAYFKYLVWCNEKSLL